VIGSVARLEAITIKADMRRIRSLQLNSMRKRPAEFIAPMECALVSKLPEGTDWTYEVKLDGYRAIGVKVSSQATIYSRNGKNFNSRYPHLAEALGDLPADTVVDGEVVALDDSGRPDFHALQHFKASASRIQYFVFDLLVLRGRDLMKMPLTKRRELMKSALKLPSEGIRVSEQFEVSAENMLSAVRKQGLEGVIAKRKSSFYEAGKRTGFWAKMRFNRGQEFVVGGLIPGPHGVDSIIVGYYRGKDLVYVARVRNGFVPAIRRMVYEKLKPLTIDRCPFVNLPETGRARWGEILDAEKMKKCVWVRATLVAAIEFLEWTEGDRLRHSKFIALRDDKDPREVIKEA
jgi:DNA ligase D-like protein (predicted ligase)